MSVGGLFWIVVAVAVGALVPLQAGLNATLASRLGQPLLAALSNTVVATLALGVLIVALRAPLPPVRLLASVPWYAWAGGLCGAALVISAIAISPRLGAAGFVSATIVGTVVASLLVDHVGLLIFEPRAVSTERLLGGALVVAGMVLLNRS